MIDIAKARIGDKVHCIDFDGQLPENGMIKQIPEDMNAVRVVYNCAGDWKNFMNYTSELTDVVYLFDGWVDT